MTGKLTAVGKKDELVVEVEDMTSDNLVALFTVYVLHRIVNNNNTDGVKTLVGISKLV